MKLSAPSLLLCIRLVLGINAQSGSPRYPIGNSSTITSKAQVTVPPSPTQLWSFIIPKENTQECNVYGVLCQTGSITVGVGSINATGTTTLPCSDYLTLQSKYLNEYNHYPCQVNPVNDRDWMREFGRGPECASFADYELRRVPYTFTNCGEKNRVATLGCGEGLVPPGIQGHYQMFDRYTCCGGCVAHIPEFRLHYFLPEDAESSCATNRTSGWNNTTTASAMTKHRQAHSLLKTAVLGTYTLTSPSVYLEVVGTAAMSDFCGGLGSVLTNPIIALPPGDVSSSVPLDFFFKEGQTYFDPGVLGIGGTVKPLNLADLACPTFGVGYSTASDGHVETTIGPPYLPIIMPPKQLTTLDPVWQKSCTNIYSVGQFLESFAIVDPPHILTPAAALAPPQVPAIETSISQSVAGQPNASPVPNTGETLPAATAAPNSSPGSNPKVFVPADSKSAPDHKISNPDVNQPSSGPPVDPATSNTDPKSNLPSKPVDPNKPPPEPKSPDFQPQESTSPLVDSADAVRPAQENDPKAPRISNQNLGRLILSALNRGKIDSSPGGNANPGQFGSGNRGGGGGTGQNNQGNSPQIHIIFSVGGQAFTATDPSKIVLPGFSKALLPGEAATIANTPVSLGSSGTLFVDNTPIPLLQPGPGQGVPIFAPVQTSGVFFAAGLPFTPLPSSQGEAIDGKTLVPGGLPVIVSGKAVSLDSSGGLRVGSSLLAVPTLPPVRGDVFPAAGFAFASLPSSEGVAIDGKTVAPGGASVTVSGTRLSSDLTGGLRVGSSVIVVPTPVPGSGGGLFTAGGLRFTLLPSSQGLAIDGKTLLPGGAPVTVSGTSLSFNPTGVLLLVSSLVVLPTPAPEGGAHVFTAGGLTFTTLPSSEGVTINGKTVAPGGAPVTVSGTRISFDPTGALHVETSLIALSTSAPSSGGDFFTAGGFIVTRLTLGLVISGTTILPGGGTATISGIPVRLDSNGTLFLGTTSSVDLSAPTHTGSFWKPSIEIPFLGEQAKSIVQGSRVLALLVGVVPGMLVFWL